MNRETFIQSLCDIETELTELGYTLNDIEQLEVDAYTEMHVFRDRADYLEALAKVINREIYCLN